jgi:hypothetical protein
MMMIMSMGWDYNSELRESAGLLFIPQENHDAMIMSTEENWLVYQSSQSVLSAVNW